jgi:hypothetical protein
MKTLSNFLIEAEKKVSGQGTQQAVGAVTETIAAAALIHRHIDKKHFKKPENQETIQTARKTYETAAPRLSLEDLENRKTHGFEQAKRIKSHLGELYPDHEIEEAHHTATQGGIERATKGKHKDSNLVNPSDVTVGLRHKKTGEMIYHGLSLKSTQKAKGDIGFKNPSPRHMDAALGTQTTKLWEKAHKDLHDYVHQHDKRFGSMTNNERKEALRKLSGNRVNRNKEQNISNNKKHQEFAENYEKIKSKTHARIRNHIVDHLQGMINSGAKGHQQVKHFLLHNYLNAGEKDGEGESDTPPMPYSKVTTNGTAKTGVTSKVEVPHQSKVAGILRDPETRLEVSRAPTGDKYIHYHAHVPQKNAKGKIIGYRRVHLFSEQVKTSSAFGNSSPRHNIQPPGKEGLNEEMREATDLKDRFKKYIKPTVKTTPKIERIANPAGRTTDHVEYKVTGPTGMVHRFKSKKEAQAHYSSFTEQKMWETWSQKYKKSIDCSNPKGFSQRAHCQGRKKKMKEHIEEAVKMTALEKFRKAAAEREKKHAEIEKNQSKDGSGLTAAIDRLSKHVNKEEVGLDEVSDTLAANYVKKRTSDYVKTMKGQVQPSDVYNKMSDKHKAGIGRAMDRIVKPVKEDSPTNAAGTGAVAGLGVGPQGEPGVNMKKKKKVIPFAMFTRKMPN